MIQSVRLDFTNHMAAQDMIIIIGREKNLSAAEAVSFSINQHIKRTILQEGYASIALGLWGHDDYTRVWERMDKPRLEVDLKEYQIKAVNLIAKEEKVDTETAVSYFLLFTVETLGYHI